MPVFRWSPLLFRLAAAVLLAGALAVPARAQVVFGQSRLIAWTYLELPYYGSSYAVALPGFARAGGWPIPGGPVAGVNGALRRLALR